MKYVANEATDFVSLAKDPGYWELTVVNKLIGTQTVQLPSEVAMTVAIAIASARDLGRREGPVKKKHDRHK